MKNEILDTPFRDSFKDFLEKGETISWIGSPNLKMHSTRNKIIGDIIFITFAAFIVLEAFLGDKVIWTNLISLLIISIIFYFKKKSKQKKIDQIQYAITSQHIIFKLKNNNFHKVPLTNIIYAKVMKNNNHFSSIELVVKKDVNFRTPIFQNNKNRTITHRERPTIENIENIDEVAQLIRQGIKNANTPS